MIFICVKWKVKPEYADQWVELTRDFTQSTLAEEGNLFFEWSRSIEDPNQYVLIEAFKDDAAEAHVTADDGTVVATAVGTFTVIPADTKSLALPEATGVPEQSAFV